MCYNNATSEKGEFLMEKEFQVEEFLQFHKVLVYFLGRNFVFSDIVQYGDGVNHGLDDLDLVDLISQYYLFETMVSTDGAIYHLEPEFKETVGRIFENTKTYFASLGKPLSPENLREEFLRRLLFHDDSKLEGRELEQNKEYLPSYLSAEEGSVLANTLEVKLRYPHRKENRHHPEYFENGIEGMNVIDLLEMTVDMVAHMLMEDKKLILLMTQFREEYQVEPMLYQLLLHTVLHSFGYLSQEEEKEQILRTVARMVNNPHYSVIEEGKKAYTLSYKEV